MLAVRPYVHTDHYWQVYFDTNKAIRDTFGAAGYPVPEAHFRHDGGVTDHRGAGRRELRRNWRWDCWTDCSVRCWAGWRRAEGAARAAGSGISSAPAAAEARAAAGSGTS